MRNQPTIARTPRRKSKATTKTPTTQIERARILSKKIVQKMKPGLKQMKPRMKTAWKKNLNQSLKRTTARPYIK